MKLIFRFIQFSMLFTMSKTGFAQKETFGVVSYSLPKGWQKQQSEAGIQLSVTDKKNGGYALAMIAQPIPSTATPKQNFDSFWETLVKQSVNVNTAPLMTTPEEGNGWTILSGSANYTDGANTGLATLLTATASGQTVNVVLMTNTKQYENELVAFINSLELSPVSTNTTVITNPNNATSGSVVGLWTYYTTENSGYINGMPMLTAGYFRREYLFKADGTYIFRVKNWSVYMKEILFVYETGKWTASGNTITLTPTRGVGEWWSKAASNKSNEWGKRVKSATWKLEPVSYNFELKYFSGTNETALILKYSKRTERDGASNSNNDANEWAYSPRDKSIIDNPPGSKFDAGSAKSVELPAEIK